MMRGLLLLLTAVLLCGCSDRRPMLDDAAAVYYWRTEWRLDSVERLFLEQHHINKVYCRYFDVVMRDGEPMPNATLTFDDTLPAGIEVVPTVYITEDCMHEWHEGLAEKTVRRICQMNETNDVSGVREIQIDCDYTANSRRLYYEFLKEVSQEWSNHNSLSTPHTSLSSFLSPLSSKAPPSPLKLSTTIRLHQLSMPVPPVDYGVLMVYNTGDPRKFMERNPILDIRDVAPYLGYLKGYELPLAAAYPVYSWQRTIHGVRIEHTVEADEILRVKTALERKRPELSRTILTYHLDKENINRYRFETYEAIYHH